MKTGEQLMTEAKARIKEMTPQQVLDRQRHGESITFLDVRDLHEVNAAKIPAAIHVSRGNLETKIEAQLPREAHVIVYCANGNRSVFAADLLQHMGYQDVASMSGGIRAWADAGGEVE